MCLIWEVLKLKLVRFSSESRDILIYTKYENSLNTLVESTLLLKSDCLPIVLFFCSFKLKHTCWFD